MSEVSGLFSDVIGAYRAAKVRELDATSAVESQQGVLSHARSSVSTASERAQTVIVEAEAHQVAAELALHRATEAEIATKREVLAGLIAVRQVADAEILALEEALPAEAEKPDGGAPPAAAAE